MTSTPAPRPSDREGAVVDEPWVAAAKALRDDLRRRGGEETEATSEDRRGPLRPGRLTPLRNRIQARLVGRLFRIVDNGSLVALAVAGAHAATPAGWVNASLMQVAPYAAGALTMIWLLAAVGLYRFPLYGRLWTRLARLTAAFGLGGALLAAATWLVGGNPPAPELGLWFGLAFVSLALLHGIWWLMVLGWRKSGLLIPNIVIVGATESADRLIEAALKSREVNVVGVFDDRLGRAPPNIRGVPVLGDLDALIGHRIMPYVDQVVIAVTSSARDRVRMLTERLSVLPNDISLVMDMDAEAAPAAISRIADAPLARVAGVPTDEKRAALKRLQDLVIGTVALVLFAPLMALVALLIKLDSPGPVFFRQRRHGFNNEEIRVWKFRSMRHETADHTASRQVTGDDDRITSVGRIIRQTSIDELPQLFNVLAGEMSLVGPRPHAVGMKTGDTESARLVAEYAHRHRLKPGMTGWAAVNGSRGPVDTPELVQRRVALDIDYIERQSFWLDLYIMAMTVPCLIGDRHVVR
ncbi:MAG TPA: exopolysaccharide biosynthesis polyprenyl glycosylphosphotransferase [Caulobacter sp.]|nr:exopolysaccharide biosynthesis polyprenyl glycosylphosphotransferase [Caulobacter sp.]